MMNSKIIFGEPKIKPLIVRNPCAVNQEVLVCKQCGKPVYAGFKRFYSCERCNAWVTDVEWQKQEIA